MNGNSHRDVHALRKEGKISEAYALGKQLVEQDRDNFYVAGAFGWVLYQKAKQFANNAGTSSAMDRKDEEVRSILAEYSHLNLRRPDLLFSLLLVQIARLDPMPSFVPSFLHWAGLDSFRQEDFEARQGREQGVVYPSLIERVASKVAKVVCESEESDTAIKRFAVELIDLALDKAQVQTPVWLLYRKAILLGSLGNISEARKLILPVIHEKGDEFWVWSAFGKIVRAEDPKLALALYSKAYLMCSDKGFAVKVLASIVEIAREVDRDDLAKWAADTGIAVRQERDWSIPDTLMEYVVADWYAAATVPEDPERAVEICAEAAEELVQSRSWKNVTYLGSFESKNGNELRRLGMRKGDESIETVFPVSMQPDWPDLRVGAPLLASVDMTCERVRINAIKPRNNGSAFDCLTPVYGVVDHHNPGRGLASIHVSASDVLLLPYKDFAEAKDWPPGSTVEALCSRHDNWLRAYAARRAAAKQTANVRIIQGPFKLNPKGFGFVGDAFVPPHVISAEADGAPVEAVAVMKPKKRHDPNSVIGWQVISMRAASPESPEGATEEMAQSGLSENVSDDGSFPTQTDKAFSKSEIRRGEETTRVDVEPEPVLPPPPDDTIGFGEVEELPEGFDISYDELPF